MSTILRQVCCDGPSITRPLRRGLLAAWLVLVALPWSPAHAQSAVPELPGLPVVLDDLKKGGHVIYLRHATTDITGSDANAVIEDCNSQRSLSDEGRAEAKAIGEAIRALAIPVGEVFSSPFCRCKDTAQLAFGHFTVDDDLYFAVNAARSDVERMTASLRRMLSTPPADGANTIIVSHTANLREAAGIWPKPEGVAIVFRPLGDGRFEALGRVAPDGWNAAASN